ncbi:acetate--CoA ligase [Marinobacterium nitratireducens]|uniref:acetate--CoA ligase n=1 Tax=Marinobacterium nitratireducens TaxID=518897 RepID=A0A918DWJ5_9GAMM|nr:acetate--CoA ligase [Marinobacterium nitratireducens]GGO85773.1 acetate--CoA ligase [Marinobacterium nitratireducens]
MAAIPPGADGSAVSYPVIHKSLSAGSTAPNLIDYEAACADFSWQSIRAELDGLPGGAGINIAHEAVDRHVGKGRGDKVALRWLGKSGECREFSFEALRRQTNRFANLLQSLGVVQGDRVFVLCTRIPELYIAALGTLKHRAVFCPLFSAFGPEPVAERVNAGEGRVLVTTRRLYEKKIAPYRESMPGLEFVLLVDEAGDSIDLPGTLDLGTLLSEAGEEYVIGPTDPEDMALLHFTSGTTGKPKGAVHVHQAVMMHYMTGKYALDLHEDDIFWCTADPGWVTGTSYGIIAPLLHGVTMLVDEPDFDGPRWYGILQEQKVTVWYTAPTAIRMLMKLGTELAQQYRYPRLRFVASVGEPLNPEAVVWGQGALGLPIHDNWWQTETGGIMIANLPALDIRPGSMGRPLPGVTATIVRRLEGGGVEPITEPDAEGELALRPGWPSMFRGYLHNEERYNRCFVDGWYLTEDLAKRDADGYFWFVGRADDVIKSAGHLIGPFEVESALIEHPAVAEAGVIGVPEPTLGQMVKAFVSLNPGYEASEALRRELLGHARKRLGAAVAPKEIAFEAKLPKTRSGKIMRRLLKARETGETLRDTSTLEN